MWTIDSTSVHTDSTVATVDGFSGGGVGATLAGISRNVASARGGLTNWATVTLAGTLYTGIGGILDPNLVWPYTAPTAGSVIYYDPGYITILPNCEICSTNNNCSAAVQFFDGTNWNEVIVVVTPYNVGYAYGVARASGSLTT